MSVSMGTYWEAVSERDRFERALLQVRTVLLDYEEPYSKMIDRAVDIVMLALKPSGTDVSLEERDTRPGDRQDASDDEGDR